MNLTAAQRAAMDAELADHLTEAERVGFWARVELRWPAAESILRALYSHAPNAAEAIDAILLCAARAAARRPSELRVIDIVRTADPAWFQRPDRVGYVTYVDRFAGTLQGVANRLDYLGELNVTYLHLMSVLQPREGANDGGYAVADYGEVDPKLGSRADLEVLADQLRARGISLCLDLVLNHTAREHEWAQLARAGSERHRDFYLVYPDRTMPDRYEESLPEVFPTLAPGNFTWDDDLAGWVWTTFNTYQWDLNYANPDVFLAMLEVIVDLVNLGVEVLRLDAIAFTWKRLGTNCQNQPEAHLLAQAYRALVDIFAPGVLIKAEAIVAPKDLVPYLGAHRLARRECDIAYHNQLMVMLWSSLATGDARLAAEALSALPPTPPTTSFCTYLRCHDDIGWAVDDEDAGRAGIDAASHRAWLAAYYRGDIPGSAALGAAFSSNADSGDERTSGTAAALSGLSRGRRDGDADLVRAGIGRILAGYGVVLGFGGIPLLYMGDELGLDNDLAYLDHPDQHDDSRWMHRPVMPWNVAARRTEPGTVESEMFSAIRHMIQTRRSQLAMSTGGDTWMHRYDDPAVLAWARTHPVNGRFFGLANVADRWASVPADSLGWAGLSDPVELLGTKVTREGDAFNLPPYAVCWFVDRADTEVMPRRP